ncbi:hypothetical protein [Micromonospora sp. SH-82]|uniref:hypothetical protein n=1 Tax=Micromonospora sp. SH-82 TaxID=3132938 RepID=UPI003EB730AA
MPQITLHLSLEQTNTVLEALGQLPYVRVFGLIETIGQQAGAQLHQPGTTPDVPQSPPGTTPTEVTA